MFKLVFDFWTDSWVCFENMNKTLGKKKAPTCLERVFGEGPYHKTSGILACYIWHVGHVRHDHRSMKNVGCSIKLL